MMYHVPRYGNELRMPTPSERNCRIEGYAIISSDGMIADAAGRMPDTLKFDADQRFLAKALARADVLVHGARSIEPANMRSRRRRIILTRRVAGVRPDPHNANVVFWNPAGASLAESLEALGIAQGVAVVLGGTDVFGLFLPLYDVFYLTRANLTVLPGGRPVFPGVPARSPEDVLSEHGFQPGPTETLDAENGLTLVAWRPS